MVVQTMILIRACDWSKFISIYIDLRKLPVIVESFVHKTTIRK